MSSPAPDPLPPNTSTAIQVLIPGSILYAIALVLVPARMITRFRSARQLYIDDYTILVAGVLAFVEYPLTIVACYYGLGRWTFYVSPENMIKALKNLYFAVFLWYPAITLIRISVACTLLRLQRWSKTWTTILWVAIVLQILAGSYGTLFSFLQCRPLRALWEPVPGANCWNGKNSLIGAYFLAGISIVNDTLFALMPISFIWKLKRPLTERILICSLMALGLTAAAAAVVKTIKFSQEDNLSGDVMRNVLTITLWCKLEELFGLVAACAPTLKRPAESLLRRLGILGGRAVRYFTISLHTFSVPPAQTNPHTSLSTSGVDVSSTEGTSSSKYANSAEITVSELPKQESSHDENARSEYDGSNAV